MPGCSTGVSTIPSPLLITVTWGRFNFSHKMGLYTELTDAILEVDVIIAGGKWTQTTRRFLRLSSANIWIPRVQVVLQAVSSPPGYQMQTRSFLFS